MIQHIVFFKFKPETTESEREELVKALGGLQEKIPLVKRLKIGIDLGRKPNSYDLALDSDFDSWKDVEAYAVHPEHMKVVLRIKELCESSCKVDFEKN